MQLPGTIFLNSIRLHTIARNGYIQAAKIMRDHKIQGKGVGLEGAHVAIIFSVASLEAFLPEVAILIDKYDAHDSSLKKLGAILHDTEESQVQVRGKFLIAKRILSNGFDRGKNPYQDFELLIRIRNAIIHMKPDVITEDPHKLVVAMQTRGLCDPADAPNNSWMDQIATLPTAKWACNVATLMIYALCSNEDGSHNPLWEMTTAFVFPILP